MSSQEIGIIMDAIMGKPLILCSYKNVGNKRRGKRVS